MRTLVIFDSSKTILARRSRAFSAGDTAYLFPMNVDKRSLEGTAGVLKSAGSKVEVIDTGRLINDTAEDLRLKYVKFIAELPGRVSYRGKNLKELFAVDDTASLWWYSLVAEKCTFKSDAFNSIVQFNSIIKIIEEKQIERILYGCDDYILGKELLRYSKEHSIAAETIAVRTLKETARNVFKSGIFVYLKHTALLFIGSRKTFLDMYRIKRAYGKVQAPVPAAGKSIFVTYYPAFDIRQADKGIYVNSNYPYLQEALKLRRAEITWVALYVQHATIPFADALGYWKRFAGNGYNIVFVDNFFSARMHINTLFPVLVNGFKLLYYRKRIKGAHEFEGHNVYGFLKNDWYASFAGFTGYTGLLYYRLFRSILGKVKGQVCVYPFEMHYWEKAIVDARNSIKSQTALFAYQPAGISRMSLNYFNHPLEINANGPYPIPVSDKLLCDGPITSGYLKTSGRDAGSLEIVEAINYYHLRRYFSDNVKEKKDEVLILLSIHPKESRSLLMAAYEAFKDSGDVRVLVKLHPYLNLNETRKLLKKAVNGIPFPVKAGPIDKCLSEARIVIAGETTASIEALAYGCEVINVDSPDWINMSPLKTMACPVVRTVRSPIELRQAVLSIFSRRYDPAANFSEARKIIEGFFYLGDKINVPERFVNLIYSESMRG
ncbi:MAG: hypothetical protein WC522_00305 [Candidatus Omnitrophota bacterium]